MTSVVQDVKTAAQDAGVTTTQPTGVAGPQGAPAGGLWVEEKYRGTMSCVACLAVPLCGMCIMCCCPIDKRTVYVVNNVKYNQMGAIVTN
ncbi:unnamed protein product [Ectocarpus sp. 8 AP-2014]